MNRNGTQPRGAQSSDAELIGAVAAGDLAALGGLFDRHAAAVRRYLARLGVDAGDVDDLVQATFLELAHAAPRFDPARPARAWLLGIATMIVRRHRRSLGQALSRLAAWARLPGAAPPPTPVEAYESDEASRILQRAFQALTPAKREAFSLVVLEGVPGDEAARVLGVPLNTLWTRLHHARLALRAALGEEELR